MDEYMTFNDAHHQYLDNLYIKCARMWEGLADTLGEEITPQTYPSYFDIPAYLRQKEHENWCNVLASGEDVWDCNCQEEN